MCDLIDLSTPDTKGLLGARLASPLIPVPSDITCDNRTSTSRKSCSLVQSATKRDSLENNPFDMVLHKTTEYIQKKDDPFEVALERALKLKHKKNIPSRTISLDFADDFTPKHKRHIQLMKLNRTLDESLIIKDFTDDDMFGKTMADDSMTVDLNDTKLFDDEIKANIPTLNGKVPNINIQNADLSILNQSVLNDTLVEPKSDLDNGKDEFILQGVSTDFQARSIIPAGMTLKVPKVRRCVSQGEKGSPKKLQYLNKTSQSVNNDTKTRSLSCGSNGSSIPCSSSMDFLNDAFFKSQCSENSVFSSLSNVSTISRSTLASCVTTSSMATSHATINRSFIESCSSDGIDPQNSLDRLDTIKTTSPVSMPLVDIETNEANTNDNLMTDLVDRLSKLKKNVLESHVSPTAIEKGKESPRSINPDNETPIITLTTDEKHDTPNKLIDVDVFKPEKTSFKESSGSSMFSDNLSSPDSVFLDAANKSRVNKSILKEAKALARTFEELALRTNSGSSSDDLMSSNPLWTSELLPAFEEEAAVENLIDLPVSPNTNEKNTDQVASDPTVHQCESKDGVNNKSTEKDLVKDLEAQLIEPEQKVSAATLLLNLKKLIKSDNNTEVNALLGNLERALGIECKNNTQLLETYLCPTNNLAKSPQKLSTNVKTVRNVEHETMEQSQEENTNIITKSPENVVDNKDINLNVSVVDKQIDASIKCMADISEEPDVLCKETTSVTKNVEKELNQSIGSPDYKALEESNDSFNEKKAVDLLGNLGRLLNGKTEEQSVLTLLKTLGKVLSTTSNESNDANSNEIENSYTPIQQTPKKSKLKSESKVRSPILMNCSNRRSLNAETKKKSSIANLLRRSISVTHSPPEKILSDTPILANKKASQLKEVRKRFPSDPGLIASAACRKSAVNSPAVIKPSTGKRTTITITDTHKEKSTAIAAAVKNKLKKKITTDVVNKRGPLKAILPISNMQRKDSITKKINTSTETLTPPKPHKIMSSTPNSVDDYAVKKSPRSKPVASSTPDLQTCKVRKIQMQPMNTTKKRNFSCDISPVVTTLNVKNSNGIKRSPKKENTLPSPRKTTPKRRPLESSIPKSFTSPVIRRANSSAEINQHDRLLQSPQRGIPKKDARKNSPVPSKNTSNRIQQSPLKDVNKPSPKVKPFNLISKLRRHSNSGNIVEKENNYI